MGVEWKIKGIYKANPQMVYDEINSIGSEYTPADVVEKARDESTELHKCFEWDDSIAAEKYRITQAGNVIRCLVVVREQVDDQELPKTRAIVSTNKRENTYEPVTVTVRHRDSYDRLLEEALRELNQFRKKYANIRELEVILNEIEDLLRAS